MRRILRSLLVLGRVSNLPTVWSNCLAGWMLAGGWLGVHTPQLLLLCAGCSLLYIGGMYLNDACDVDFDTLHRPERPIPAGVIDRRTVTLLGLLGLAAGTLTLLWLTPGGAGWIAALAGLIVLYDLWHKKNAIAPVLMAGCRVLIYPVATAVVETYFETVQSRSYLPWVGAFCMGTWILALSFLARTEATPGPLGKPTPLLYAIPMIFVGIGPHSASALIPLLLLSIWIVRCVWLLRRTGQIGAAVGDLLAGIPLVDLYTVSPPLGTAYAPYLACMLLALILRRSIPPT